MKALRKDLPVLDAARHLLMVLAATLVIWGVGLEQAYSHATLTASTPADGKVLDKAPTTILLHFNEPVSLLASTLVHPSGETVPLEQFKVAGEVVTIDLPANLSFGSYAVSWRVVSDDGHPIAATTFFVVGEATGATSREDPTVNAEVSYAIWIVRLIVLGSLMFGVGGAAFRLVAGELPLPAKTWVRLALASGLVAAPLVVGLQGLDLLGLGIAGLMRVPTWLAGFGSPFGTTAMFSACSIACALFALEVSSNRLSLFANTTALTLLGLSVCFSGHASVAEPRWLSGFALFLHVISISWWVGALVPLAFFLNLERRQAAPSLIRFSRYIPYAILPLLASGAILAVLQLGAPGPSWWSAYGLIFACKLVLVVVLLAVASWNRWILTAPAAAGKAHALSQMRRGIALEIVLCVLILALVSAWRFTPPPRALVHRSPIAMELMLEGPSFGAKVTISDVRTGTSDITVQILPPGSGPLEARSLKIAMHPPGTALAPVVREGGSAGAGTWVANQVPLPVAGTWTIDIEVRITDFDLVKLKGMLEIKPR